MQSQLTVSLFKVFTGGFPKALHKAVFDKGAQQQLYQRKSYQMNSSNII